MHTSLRWLEMSLVSLLVLPSLGGAQETAATAVEVSNFPQEQKVRVTNLDDLKGGESVVSVAVHTDKPERTVPVLTVPADQVLILSDIQFGDTQDVGYRLEDGDAPQLFFRVAPGQALHYETGVVFGPGEAVRVKRSDGEPLHPFEATFMGRLVPAS
jgi:hypothetical protein